MDFDAYRSVPLSFVRCDAEVVADFRNAIAFLQANNLSDVALSKMLEESMSKTLRELEEKYNDGDPFPDTPVPLKCGPRKKKKHGRSGADE